MTNSKACAKALMLSKKYETTFVVFMNDDDCKDFGLAQQDKYEGRDENVVAIFTNGCQEQ